MRGIVPVAISLILFATVLFTNVNAASPPITFSNNSNYYITTAHFGRGTTNQWIHPDILYFPNGWGDVNGSKYKYWLTVTGYPGGDEDYEQPIILCSNSITSSDAFVEPANNYYGTNPLTKWYFTDGDNTGGHYDDSDIIYNDDTDELWVYYLNTTRPNQWLEMVKSSDGVNWSSIYNISSYSPSLFYNDGTNGNGFIVSPAIIKEGNNWYMWAINITNSPNDLVLYNSTDGLHWHFKHNCGHDFVTDISTRDAWHINVVKYDGFYWGILTECNNGQSAGATKLALIKSSDGENWAGYDSEVMVPSTSGWDDDEIYRSAALIQNGNFTLVYTGCSTSAIWHTSWTYNNSFGGTGVSDNVITTTPSNTSASDSESFGISLPVDYTATPTPPHHDSDIEYFGISIPINYSADKNSSGFIIQASNIPYLIIAGLAVFFPILGLLMYKEKRR